MADENITGVVSVDVVAVDRTGPGLAAAEASVRAADARMAATFTNAAASAKAAGGAFSGLTVQTQQLQVAIANSGASLAQYGATLRNLPGAERVQQLAAYQELLATRTALATQAASQQATALAGDTSGLTANANAAKAAAASIEAYSAAQLRSRMALTAQQQGVFTGGAARGDLAADAATLAFQMRMSRQQATEAQAAARATEQADAAQAASMAVVAKQADALRSKIDPLAGAELKRAAAVREADSLLQAGAITETEYAAAIALATAAYETNTEAVAKNDITQSALFRKLTGGRSVYEAEAASRALMTGNMGRLDSALAVEAARLNLVQYLFSATGLSIAALAAAAIAGVVAMSQLEESQRRLMATTVGLGAASGVTAAQITAAASQATEASGLSGGAALKAAEEFASAGVRSQSTIEGLVEISRTYADLTGEKLPKAEQDLASAMRDPDKGAKDLNESFSLLNSVQTEQVEQLVAMGDKAGADAIIFAALKQRTDEAHQAGAGLTGQLQAMVTWAGNAWTAFGQLNQQLMLFSQLGFASGAFQANAQQQAQAAAAAAQHQAQLNAASNLGEGAYAGTAAGEMEARRRELRGHMVEANEAIKADTELFGANSEAVKHDKESIQEYGFALASLRTEAQKKTDTDRLEQQILVAKHAHNQALIRDLEAQKALISQSGIVESPQEAGVLAAAAGNLGATRAAGRGRHPKDTFTPQQASVVADTRAELDLAQAYLTSDAAAIRAEASREALTKGTLQGRNAAQQAEMVQNEINLAVAKGAAEGAKRVANLEAQVAAEREANDAVAAGTAGRQEAERAARMELQFRPLLADAALATGKARDLDTQAINRERAALEALNTEDTRKQAIDARDKANDELARAQLDARLSGPGQARERAVQGAELSQRQTFGLGPAEQGTAEQQQAISAQGRTAGIKVDLEQARRVDELVRSTNAETAAQLADANAIGMNRAQAEKLKEEQKLLNEATKDGNTLTDQQRARVLAAADALAQQTENTKKLTDATKASVDASNALGDSLEKVIETAIFNGKDLQQTLRSVAEELGKEALKGALTGQGPFAGFMGTNQTPVEGGPNKGILSQLTGSLFREPGTEGAKLFGTAHSLGGAGPSGRSGDPIHVVMDFGQPSGAQAISPAVSGAATQAGVPASSVQAISQQEAAIGIGAGAQRAPTGNQVDPLYVTAIGSALGAPTTGASAAGGGQGTATNPMYVYVLNQVSSGSSGSSGNPLSSALSSLFGGGQFGAGFSSLGGGQSGGLLGGFMSLFGSGGGESLGAGAAAAAPDLAGLFHTGGLVGAPSRMVSVEPKLFLNAPRLHRGLAPDEFPAILQRGERVSPARGGGRGSTSVTINVSGVQDAGGFHRSQGQIGRETKRQLATVR